MKCKCGGDMKVVDSAPYKQAVYRRRKCLKCGMRIHIEERIDESGCAKLMLSKKSTRRRLDNG